MVDVIEIVLDALAHPLIGIGLPAIAVNLRPAGNPRLHVVPACVQGDPVLVLTVVGHGVGPGADERHIALEHVEKLRDLVDVPAPKPAADPGHAGIVPGRLPYHDSIIERVHNTELDDPKPALVEAVSTL